jgi:hypothetical protein
VLIKSDLIQIRVAARLRGGAVAAEEFVERIAIPRHT